MSHLIIFDMEWNMGYAPKTFDYHGIEENLRGEVIQIGAVKMEGQEIRDTFRVTLRPRIFRKLHHRVAKVTGLTQKEINAGLPISEGLRKFRAWCGEDAVLGEWGQDDMPVLKQNLFLVGQDESWPGKWYDLQKVYTAQRPLKEGEGMALETVVDRLGIEKEDSFHDALADAMYTAKVMQFVDIQKGLETYPDDEAQLKALLCPPDKDRHDFISWPGFVDGETWRTDNTMRTANCPECGRPLKPDSADLWLSKGKNCLYSIEICRQHGPAMVWLRRSQLDGLHYRFARATEKADKTAQAKWDHEKKAAAERARRKREAEAAERQNGGRPQSAGRPQQKPRPMGHKMG